MSACRGDLDVCVDTRPCRTHIVSDIRGAYVRIRFQNGVRPEKRAAGRESCRFSLVVCYTATGKWPMHSFIAYYGRTMPDVSINFDALWRVWR